MCRTAPGPSPAAALLAWGGWTVVPRARQPCLRGPRRDSHCCRGLAHVCSSAASWRNKLSVQSHPLVFERVAGRRIHCEVTQGCSCGSCTPGTALRVTDLPSSPTHPACQRGLAAPGTLQAEVQALAQPPGMPRGCGARPAPHLSCMGLAASPHFPASPAPCFPKVGGALTLPGQRCRDGAPGLLKLPALERPHLWAVGGGDRSAAEHSCCSADCTGGLVIKYLGCLTVLGDL